MESGATMFRQLFLIPGNYWASPKAGLRQRGIESITPVRRLGYFYLQPAAREVVPGAEKKNISVHPAVSRSVIDEPVYNYRTTGETRA